jgi:hypothetical protein
LFSFCLLNKIKKGLFVPCGRIPTYVTTINAKRLCGSLFAFGLKPKREKGREKTKECYIFEKHGSCFFLEGGVRFYPGSPSGVISLTRGAGMMPESCQILNAHWFSTSLREWNSSHEEVMTVSVRGWGAEECIVSSYAEGGK